MSDDVPFYAANHPPVTAPASEPKPREALWTLRKGGARLGADLLDHGHHGVEVQLLRDGAFFYGRRHENRDLALWEAMQLRREYERDGWISPAS